MKLPMKWECIRDEERKRRVRATKKKNGELGVGMLMHEAKTGTLLFSREAVTRFDFRMFFQ